MVYCCTQGAPALQPNRLHWLRHVGPTDVMVIHLGADPSSVATCEDSGQGGGQQFIRNNDGRDGQI